MTAEFRRDKKARPARAVLLSLSLLFGQWSPAVRVADAQAGRMIPEKRLGAATASYFAKAKHVTVQVRPQRVAGDEREGVVMIASFIVPGKKVVEPKLVNLQFIVDAPAAARPPGRRVQVFSEGRELAAGTATLISTGGLAGGTVTRVLMYKIPYRRFVQLLNSEGARVSLGRVEFDVTQEHLAAMRDLRRMIAEGVSFP